MNDIVERLRVRGFNARYQPTGLGQLSDMIFDEAATEIERLRAASNDFLAALEEAKRELEAYENERTGELYNSLMINAAIAKAKGEA